MSYSLHQVRFPEPCSPIQKKWIIDFSWRLSDRMCRSSGKLIRLSDHKMIESITIA